MANTTMLYEVPDPSNTTTTELLVGYPNKVMGGAFGTEIIFIVFGGAFMTFLAMRYGPRVSFLMGAFASWITSLAMLSFGSMFGYTLAGSGAVTVTSVLVIIGLIANYMGGGGAR